MVSKSAVRTGVLLVLALGIVTMLAGPVAASNHCTGDSEEWPCGDEDEERPPLYDGPEPDVGGNVSDALGSLPEVGELVPAPE